MYMRIYLHIHVYIPHEKLFGIQRVSNHELGTSAYRRGPTCESYKSGMNVSFEVLVPIQLQTGTRVETRRGRKSRNLLGRYVYILVGIY